MMSSHRDGETSMRAGIALESLREIASQNTYVPCGMELEGAAFDSLIRAARAGRVIMETSDVATAAEAGLCSSAGTLTAYGQELAAFVSGSTRWMAVRASSRGTTSRFWAWYLDGRALVAAETPVDAQVGGQKPSVWAETVDANRVLHRVASWLRLGPAWTFGDDSVELTCEEFDRKIADPAVPAPPSLGPNARRNWEEPWTLWELSWGGADSGSEGGSDEAFVRAGDSGYFVVTEREPPRVHLLALPAEAIFRTVLRSVTDA